MELFKIFIATIIAGLAVLGGVSLYIMAWEAGMSKWKKVVIVIIISAGLLAVGVYLFGMLISGIAGG